MRTTLAVHPLEDQVLDYLQRKGGRLPLHRLYNCFSRRGFSQNELTIALSSLREQDRVTCNGSNWQVKGGAR